MASAVKKRKVFAPDEPLEEAHFCFEDYSDWRLHYFAKSAGLDVSSFREREDVIRALKAHPPNATWLRQLLALNQWPDRVSSTSDFFRWLLSIVQPPMVLMTSMLCIAAQTEAFWGVDALLIHGAHINGSPGIRPIEVAKDYKKLDMVKYLVERGAQVDQSETKRVEEGGAQGQPKQNGTVQDAQHMRLDAQTVATAMKKKVKLQTDLKKVKVGTKLASHGGTQALPKPKAGEPCVTPKVPKKKAKAPTETKQAVVVSNETGAEQSLEPSSEAAATSTLKRKVKSKPVPVTPAETKAEQSDATETPAAKKKKSITAPEKSALKEQVFAVMKCHTGGVLFNQKMIRRLMEQAQGLPELAMDVHRFRIKKFMDEFNGVLTTPVSHATTTTTTIATTPTVTTTITTSNAASTVTTSTTPTSTPTTSATTTATVAAATNTPTTVPISGSSSSAVFGLQHTKYVEAYTAARVPTFSFELFSQVKNVIYFYAQTRSSPQHQANSAACDQLIQALQKEQLDEESKRDDFLGEVPRVAQRLWSSSSALMLANGQKIEFCSIVNCLLREDNAEIMKCLAPLCRSINVLVTKRRSKHVITLPENNTLYRGGSLPNLYRSFFEVGKKYRVAGYLATSSLQLTTLHFMKHAYREKQPVVQWIIHLDPKYGCEQVAFVESSNHPGEVEYLFVAFSVFTVRKVEWSSPNNWTTPHVIELEAAVDNQIEMDLEMDQGIALPLAPWS